MKAVIEIANINLSEEQREYKVMTFRTEFEAKLYIDMIHEKLKDSFNVYGTNKHDQLYIPDNNGLILRLCDIVNMI